MSSEEQPITGLCIVEDCTPTGYVKIDKCHDNPRAEADMWKDSMFAKKVRRYLCITRIFPLDGGRLNNVLVDIAVQDDTEAVLPGYSKIYQTQDTSEQALKKKQLCVKLVPRSSVTQAINEVIFLCRSSHPPSGYTMAAGDLGNLKLCYKVGPVPAEQQRPSSNFLSGSMASGSSSNQGSPLPYPMPGQMQMINVQGSSDRGHTDASVHPLSGVPFEINPKYLPSGSDQDALLSIQCKSRDAIFNTFSYSFQAEEQALSTYQNFNQLSGVFNGI